MLIKVDLWTVGRTENSLAALLQLPTSSRCVPIHLDDNQAHTLLTAMGDEFYRSSPQGSGLIINLAKIVDIKFIALEILPRKKKPNRTRRLSADEKYNTILRLSIGETKFSLEAEIVDALIIAIRKEIPIFIAETITQEEAMGADTSDSDIPHSIRLVNLRNELQKFVQIEDYERAAQIRDEINRIQKIVESDSL